MKAILVHQPGGPEQLLLEEPPTPLPAAGEALVRIVAAGVNFIDVYHRTGLYPAEPPVAIGLEGAGIVEATGRPAAVRPGDRVAWCGIPGSYATHLLAPADRLVPIPANLRLEDAAASMIQGMTAHYLTHDTFPLTAGQTCLVHAGAGGVGLLLCQMARARGARVIATTGSAGKARRAREAGAEEVILYREEDFAAAVKRITAGRGVAVVYDSVGRNTFAGSLDCLSRRGMLVLYGQSSGPVEPLDPQMLNRKGSLFLTRPSLFHHVETREELLARAGEVLGAVASGTLRVRIDRTLPLSRAARAHRALESRETSGKILLLPGEAS